MGADLCLEYVTIKQSKRPDWAKGLAKIKALENKYKKDPESFEIDEDTFGPDVDGDDIIDLLKSDFIELKQGVMKLQRRDLTRITVGTYYAYITGGMTWGDDPTDGYGSFARLTAYGITKACGFDF
jgi:hypothetical protein